MLPFDGYSLVNRVQNRVPLFGNSNYRRFGTEGSEVQILSPDPFPQENPHD